MANFVLIPGFWLGAWAWDEVAMALRAAGHEVRPLTLPGVAERRLEGSPDTSAEDHVTDVVATIVGADLRDVVLVGHSGGGPLAAGVAERVPERIARLVFVDSGPLPDGLAQADFGPPDAGRWIRARIAAHDGWYPLPTVAEFESLGTSVAGIDDDGLARMTNLATPHPGAAVLTGARRTGEPLAVPITVVACSFTAAEARSVIESGAPGFAELAGAEFVDLPTGHWPMFSRPADLAEILIEAGVSATVS